MNFYKTMIDTLETLILCGCFNKKTSPTISGCSLETQIEEFNQSILLHQLQSCLVNKFLKDFQGATFDAGTSLGHSSPQGNVGRCSRMGNSPTVKPDTKAGGLW